MSLDHNHHIVFTPLKHPEEIPRAVPEHLDLAFYERLAALDGSREVDLWGPSTRFRGVITKDPIDPKAFTLRTGTWSSTGRHLSMEIKDGMVTQVAIRTVNDADVRFEMDGTSVYVCYGSKARALIMPFTFDPVKKNEFTLLGSMVIRALSIHGLQRQRAGHDTGGWLPMLERVKLRRLPTTMSFSLNI